MTKGFKFLSADGWHKLYLLSTNKFTAEEQAKSKTLLFVGETGSGKTTILNALANYLQDVQFEDNFRFYLIPESQNNQSASQTKQITIYDIQSKKKGVSSIRVIDTPGIGDTEGINQDEKTVQQLEQLFKNQIKQIDSVVFVIKSNNFRLTAFVQYIFDKILMIFGNDIAENILVMLTFSDIDVSNIIQTLKSPQSSFHKIVNKMQAK